MIEAIEHRLCAAPIEGEHREDEGDHLDHGQSRHRTAARGVRRDQPGRQRAEGVGYNSGHRAEADDEIVERLEKPGGPATCDKTNKVAKIAEMTIPIAGTPFCESRPKTGGNKSVTRGCHRNLTHKQGPAVESA